MNTHLINLPHIAQSLLPLINNPIIKRPNRVKYPTMYDTPKKLAHKWKDIANSIVRILYKYEGTGGVNTDLLAEEVGVSLFAINTKLRAMLSENIVEYTEVSRKRYYKLTQEFKNDWFN